MNTKPIVALKVALLGILIAGFSSCGEKQNASGSSKTTPSQALPAAQIPTDSASAPWTTSESEDMRTVAREKIKNSGLSPGKRLEVARDMIKSMSGRDAKVAGVILADMVNNDLLANSEIGAEGEMVILVAAGDLQLVEQAYQHLVGIAPREAALVLPEIPAEVGEELVDRMLSKNTEWDERALREFQAGLDHDAAAALPWRLAREWARAYGEDAALGHLEKISAFLPAPPADMLARMRNSLASGQ